MTQVEKLKVRFEEAQVNNFSVFPGSNPNVTPEQLAKALNDALDRLEVGDYTPVV